MKTTIEWGIRYTSPMTIEMSGSHPVVVSPMHSKRSAQLALSHKIGFGRHEDATLVCREVTEWKEVQ